eukprot:83935_1
MNVIKNDRTTWKCDICTYTNQSLHSSCSMCGFQQKNSKCQTYWTCSACTFRNDASVSCDVCGTRNPNIDMSCAHGTNDDLFNPPSTVVELPFVKRKGSMQDFAFVVADIACYASNCSSVYHTLNSITKKLMTCDIRYRTLDTSRAKVMERLIGFEGVLEFLMLLGFESDVLGMKLQCKEQPRADFVMPIRDLLQRYMQMYEDPNCNTVDEMISSTYDNAQSSEILKRLVLTHKMFTNSVTFLAIISSKITVQTVQILKNWMNSYWYEDFYDNHELQSQLQQCLEAFNVHKSGKQNGLQYKQNDIYFADNYDIWSGVSAANISNQITLIHHRLFCQIKPREYVNNIIHGSSIAFSKATLSYHIADIHDPVNCLTADNIIRIVTHWHRKLPDDIIYLIMHSYKEKKEPLAPHLSAFVQQFHTFVKFLQLEILQEQTFTKRMEKLKRILRMGQHFRTSSDYYSLFAVFSMLKSKAMQNVMLIWKHHLSEEHRKLIREWSVIFDACGEDRNLRHCLRESDMKKRPCIPHIGTVLLRDLHTIYTEECGGFPLERSLCCINCVRKSKENNTVCTTMYLKCLRIAERIYQFNPREMAGYKDVIKQDGYLQNALAIRFVDCKTITNKELCNLSETIAGKDAELVKVKGKPRGKPFRKYSI